MTTADRSRIGGEIENSAAFGDRSDSVCEDFERRSFYRRPFDHRPGRAPLYRAQLRRLGVIHAHTHNGGNAAKSATGKNCLRLQDKDSSRSSVAERGIFQPGQGRVKLMRPRACLNWKRGKRPTGAIWLAALLGSLVLLQFQVMAQT